MASEERKNYVSLAKLAEEDERHEDVLELMQKVARLGVELMKEERILLSKSMKESVKNQIEMESELLVTTCCDMIRLIDEHLLPSSSTHESIVYFYKMKGDCNRYMAEFKTGNERTKAIDDALEAYNKGSQIAELELTPKNCYRLGLALNMSVLYYDTMKLPLKAINHARLALDEADDDIGSLSMDEYDESYPVISVLRSNLFFWDSVSRGASDAGRGIPVMQEEEYVL